MRRFGRAREFFAFGDAAVLAALSFAVVFDSSPSAPNGPERRELVELRTEYAKTFQNRNGSRTTSTYAVPVHFDDGSGVMQEISTRLVPHGKGSVINERGGFRTAFDRTSGEDFVRIQTGNSRVGLTLEGARPAPAAVNGPTVRYDDVATDTSLEYMTTPESVKETLVLRSPRAPSSFRFRLSKLDGRDLRPQRQGDGSWALYERGTRRAHMVLDAPWAVDARGRGRESSGARLVVTREGDDLVLQLTISERWLNAPNRAFPVRLDPTVSMSLSGWGYWDTRCAACGGSDYYEIKAGASSTQTFRSILRFGVGAPAGATITNATIFTEAEWCVVPGCQSQSHTISAHRVTSGWSLASTASELAFDATPLASYTLTAPWTQQFMSFNVTGTAQSWHRADTPNYGILIKKTNETPGSSGPVGYYYKARMDTTWVHDRVTLYEPQVLNRTGATLLWSKFAGTGFASYDVHRGSSAGFTPTAQTLLASITDLETTLYRDDSARPGTTAYYKVVTGGVASNEQAAALPAETQPARSVLQPDPFRGQTTDIRQIPDPNGGCTNFSQETVLEVGPGSAGLVEFDLRAIPADSRVASATLSLYRTEHSPAAATTLQASAVAREWREASNSFCSSDGATWTHAFDGSPWTTPGGDAETGGPTSSVPTDTPPGWQQWNVKDLVQGWIAGTRPNNGVRITKSGADVIRLATDDYTISPALRPKLEIVYDDPEPVGTPTAVLVTPANGDRVRDTIPVEANAGDDRRVERVEFLLDGNEFFEDATAPYATNWDTRGATNGSHTLRARAVDDAGNIGLSDPVTVDVANFAPPSVTVTRPPTGYAETVKADAPSAYWRLGETSGTSAVDASGNGRNGTYSGSYVLGLSGLLTGDPNLSVRLNAGSGKVSTAGFSGLLTPNVSVEAWVKHYGFTSPADTQIVSRDFGAVGGWALGVRNSGGSQQAYFALRTSSGVTYATTAIAPSAMSGTVYHLVGTFNGSQLRLWVDGLSDGWWTPTATATGSTAPIVVGNATAANLVVDEVAVYPSILNSEQIKAHHEVGRGRLFRVEADNELRATATAAPGRTVREVEFLVDDQLVAKDQTAPYSVTWSTLAAGAVVPDGPHVVTARAIDDHDRDATSSPVTVNVNNNTATTKQAQITAASALPETLVDENGPWEADTEVDIRVKNVGSGTIGASDAVLRYRWKRPDGTFDDSVSTSYPLGASIAPGAERIVRVTVRPPNLPSGLARSRMTLHFDLRDTVAPQTWWSTRGNPPLEHSVLIQREGQIGLGLERYYHYDGEEVGAGMTNIVNLASGNNILRLSPLASEGRGFSTVVDLTYNSQAGESRGSAIGAAWWLSISSLSPFGEPLRCGYGSHYELKPHKCEELALEGGSDKTGLVMDLVDGDGTVHRFTGRRTGGRTFWAAPQGVHLYLRQLEADEQPSCDIVENGMQYTSYQSTIRALWAFTRPDGVTFYYQRNGWPTGVRDRNGNCMDFELYAPGGDQDRVRVTEVVDAAGVATPSLRARRAYTLEYYDSGHHHKHGGKDRTPKVKAIRDHTGSKIWFEYYKDDRLNKIGQEGGTTVDGLSAPTRAWSFTYTRWWDDDDEYTSPRIASASERSHPDHNINDNSNLIYSVRDPRGNETKFEYYGRWPSTSKATRLKQRTDRAGNTTSFSYDTSARTTTQNRPLGRDTRYEFDAEGSVLRMIDKVTATTEETSSVSWTADRQVFKVTEPTGRFSEFEYNQNGYMTKQWDQLRRLTELQYENLPVDDDDVPAGWVQPGRTIPHISQLTKRITPRGKQWQFDHQDSTGNLLKLTDPEGFASRFVYNADGTLARSEAGLDDDGSPTPPKAAGEPDRITLYELYDANGIPTKITDPVGAVTRVCHDDDGQLRWVQDARHASSPLPSDYSRCFEHQGRAYRSYLDYDPLHRLARSSDPKLSSAPGTPELLWTHVRYDANDNVVDDFNAQQGPTFREGAGNRTSTTFDPMDRPTRETLFDFTTALDANNQQQSTEREETSQIAYDAAGRPSQVTAPRGVATAAADDYSESTVYDLLDRPLRMTATGVSETRTVSYCYDRAGDVRSITRQRNAPITVSCGDDGAALGTPYTERRAYTDAHELRSLTDPEGNVATQTYDLDGNPVESTDAEGAKVTRTWDGREQITQVVEDFEVGGAPRPTTTRFAYDAVGNLKHLYTPRAIEAAGAGGPGPNHDFVTTYEYDGLDRVTRTLLPKMGSEPRRYTHRRYDEVGNLTHVSVPVREGNLATILASEPETKRWVTRYRHFDTGWIRSSEDKSPRVDYEYSPEGWQISRIPGDRPNRETKRSYYRDGQLETFSDERGNTVLRHYDLNGNLTFLNDAGVSSDRKRMTFDIDHNGFDEVSSTTSREEGRNSKITTYTYWADGLVRTRAEDREENSGGTVVRQPRRHEFNYDQDGRLTEQLDFGRDSGTADDKRITTVYRPTDREQERVVQHWIGGSFQTRHTTQKEYFANGLLRTLRTYGGAGGGANLRESHTLHYRDPAGVFLNGHRTRDEFFRASPKATAPCRVAANPCTQRWSYDGADRLIEENDGHGNRTSYELEPAGGIATRRNADTGAVKTSAQYDGTRMTSFTKAGATTKMHYDVEGNLDCTTLETGGPGDCNGQGTTANVVEDYTYDYRNRLKGWEMPSANKSTAYDHDAIDRPVKEVEKAGAATTTHDLSYVGATRQLAEERETGARERTRSYSYDAFGRRIGMTYQAGTGSPRELTYGEDPSGNVSMLINDAGDVKASYGYTAYGEVDQDLTAERLPDDDTEPGTDDRVNSFRFSGQRTDSSGKINMGTRAFGPDIGAFLQEDRYDSALQDLELSTDPLTANRYSLASGNPISFVEFDGHGPIVNSGAEARAVNRQIAEGRRRQAQEDGGSSSSSPSSSGGGSAGGGSSSSSSSRKSSGGGGAADRKRNRAAKARLNQEVGRAAVLGAYELDPGADDGVSLAASTITVGGTYLSKTAAQHRRKLSSARYRLGNDMRVPRHIREGRQAGAQKNFESNRSQAGLGSKLKWAGRGLTAAGAFFQYQSNRAEGDSVGRAAFRTGVSTAAGALTTGAITASCTFAAAICAPIAIGAGAAVSVFVNDVVAPFVWDNAGEIADAALGPVDEGIGKIDEGIDEVGDFLGL
jgi:RHS repeat-associated protein